MKKILINLALLIFSVTALSAEEKLKLIHAEEMSQVEKPQGLVKIVKGDVLFRKGDVDLVCEKAYWYENKAQIDFFQKVVVTNENKKLTADTLIYFYDEDRIMARGNPVVVDSNKTIRGRELEYFTELDIVKATGDVDYSTEQNQLFADYLTYYADSSKTIASKNCRFIDLKENNILESDSILYFNEKDEMSAYINPVLIKTDSTGKEVSRIEGEVISGEKAKSKFLSIGNVKIIQEDMTAYGDSANYDDSTGVVLLTGSPKVLNKDQEIQGDHIKAKILDGEIQNLHIIGSATATSSSIAYYPIPANDTTSTAPDSVKTRDEMTGKLMEIYFVEGDIDSIRVSGMATSYYNVLEDSILQGVNDASGDTVIMLFEDDALNKISIIGGTQGKFIPDKTNKSVDTTVVYGGEKIDYIVQERKTNLFKNSSVTFGDAELTAGQISVLWNENLLYAYPEDTTQTDSVDATYPQMIQKGRDPFIGREMVYNIKTQRGRIFDGKTEMDEGFYYGENIKKKGKKTFYIDDGIYTTCDKEHPHFHFKSTKMKMIQKDKIFARPIVMYIHDIPLLALPFAVLPNQGGSRHSGWIMPTYGSNASVGNYLRGLGYFWVINDYTDLKVTTDFFDEKGVRVNLKNRYKIRYKLSGNVALSLEDFMLKDSPERNWKLSLNHSHTISPTASFRASGSFVSNDQYRKNGLDIEDRLEQQLISNATFSKSWRGTPYSMTANLSQTINLQATNEIETAPSSEGSTQSYIKRTFPSVSFRKSSARLIPLRSSQSSSDAKWYNEIRYSASSQIINKQNIYYEGYNDEKLDSLMWEKKNEIQNGVQNGISLSTSQRVSYFSLTQSMSIDEDWVFELNKPLYKNGSIQLVDNEVQTIKETAFFPRHTGSMSVGINTKLYGLFPVKVGNLQAIRHVLTPKVSFSYTPDFTDKILGWDPGYVYHYQDTSGKSQTYDPFAETLIGSTPGSESKRMSFSLSNTFQAKSEKDGKENKFDLFTLSTSFSNNLTADSLNWSTISTTIRTELKNLKLNFSVTHDPYKYDTEKSSRVNEWNDTFYSIPVPRLTYASASTSISLKSSDFGNGKPPAPSDSLNTEIHKQTQENRKASDLWSLSMSFRYSLSQSTPSSRTESFKMGVSAKLNLTKNWKIGYSTQVDLLDRSLYSQSFSVDRDLHCWEFALTWTPTGTYRGGSFVIRAKASTLQDLKWKKPTGHQSGYGF